MSASIFACVLAAVVALIVAGVSLMFAANAISLTRTVRREWETSKPAKVAGEVEGLREELLAHKRLMRAELGRVWQRMPRPAGYTEPPSFDDGQRALIGQIVPPRAADIDPEFAAELALQNAPAVSPGLTR